MDTDPSDARSDCSSELSETQSELEARIYGIIHHNDFSGTTVAPSIDPKYGVEFTANGEVVVFLKDPVDVVAENRDVELTVVCENRVIPTIVLDDDDDDGGGGGGDYVDNSIDTTSDIEFAETSLKKKRKKKKKKTLDVDSIEEYINVVKSTNALEEYKEKSGLFKMKPHGSGTSKVALNVAFNNERAMPMTTSEVLKQYRIGKKTECSLWYRCPDTWTPDMVKYYTKIQKSKRNYDCQEELQKIRDKYGSSPIDWSLGPMDLYKSHSNTPKVRCNSCRQFGHTAYNCKDQYKPEICIMCGIEGHNFHGCNKKLCFSCGTWQKKFTNNCNICMSMSKTKCSMCNTVGHESNYCTESWRQFHSTISTAQEPERNKFAQSTSRLNLHGSRSTFRKSETSTTPSTPEVKETSCIKSPKTNDSDKASKKRKLKRLRGKKKNPITNNPNLSISENESINIDVNIQDTVVKRTLTKKNFFKKKKFSDSYKN